jgi:streptomycin 6-kinase
MDDSRDRAADRLLAMVRPAWDGARAERILAAVMEQLHGRRSPPRRLLPLSARLKITRAAR